MGKYEKAFAYTYIAFGLVLVVLYVIHLSLIILGCKQ